MSTYPQTTLAADAHLAKGQFLPEEQTLNQAKVRRINTLIIIIIIYIYMIALGLPPFCPLHSTNKQVYFINYCAQVKLKNKKIKIKLLSEVLLLWLYGPLLGLGRFFSFLILYTAGRTPWMGDQPVARPLPTYRKKYRINAHNTNIHALSGIRTHDRSVRANEDSSSLRPRGHCDQL
jgi:hypothetical protein